MQTLLFTKNGIVIKSISSKNDEIESSKLIDQTLPISWYFNYPIDLEEGLTLFDIITELTNYPFLDKVFINDLNGLSISNLINLIRSNSCISNKVDLDLLCASRINLENENNEFIQFSTIVALSEDDEVESDDLSDDESDDEYTEFDEPVTMSELTASQILTTPLILDEEVDFVKMTNPTDIIYSGINRWTLFSMLQVIFNEVATSIYLNGMHSTSKPTIFTASALFEKFSELDKILIKKTK